MRGLVEGDKFLISRWAGTISQRRVEERGVTLHPGDTVAVRVDRKNPIGESWSLIFAEEK